MDLKLVKELRDKTGISMAKCQEALAKADNNLEAAIELLKAQGEKAAAKRTERQTHEGFIGSYLHSNGKVAVLVEVDCETDFVARNEDFKEFAREIAMHIAAANPLYVKPEDVPADILEKEVVIWKEQLKAEGKPENIINGIIEGKKKKYFEDACLLNQPFIKNEDQTIGDLLKEKVLKIGENIQIARFIRYSL